MAKKRLLSITELPNELTDDIDIASAEEICRLFRQSDAQMFVGWRHYPALRDDVIIGKFQVAVERIARILKKRGKKKIIITGAGTSGRLAMLVCRTFNYMLEDLGEEPVFDYLIAGTNKALIKAQEGAEDDPHQAVVELKEKVGSAKHVAFVGITCGFSAPYIAGQLDYTSKQKGYFSVFLGFNPVERGRDVNIEKWDKTVLQVLREVEDNPDCLILNPVLGPEPITGSTRMKGGSATKFMLELVFTLAFLKAGLLTRRKLTLPELRKGKDLAEDVHLFLDYYSHACVDTYKEIDPISDVMNAAGDALNNNGHIYYIGESPFAVLGTVDASECPPTFGADFGDVRGFIKNGWEWMLAGGDDSYLVDSEEPWYRIDLEEFKTELLPKVTKHDIVIGIAYNTQKMGTIRPVLEQAKKNNARTAVIFVNAATIDQRTKKVVDYIIAPSLEYVAPIRGYDFFGQLSLKLILNAITTGAHIFKGKIYNNRMVDLRISNNKLFYRTMGILNDILGVDKKTARRAVIKAIYHTDNPTTAQLRRPISKHVDEATPQEKIVPLAILLSTGKFNVKQAERIIQQNPIIRTIVEKYIK